MSKRSTEHILKQVEWLNKLKNERKCELVELEYTKKGYRYDVFGQTKDGKTIICEIGNIHEGKYKTLLAKHKRGAIEFIYIPLNEEEADIALERNLFRFFAFKKFVDSASSPFIDFERFR